MGNDPTETKQEESVWQVQLGDAGCMMTRRELDAALAREDIDPYTLVREPGTLRWLSLGTVRGIDSETMNLTSNDVEIVPSDYKPSFVAPRPVPIETERERPPELMSEELTKAERALARPRISFLPRLVLVGAATFVGVFFAQRYLPSLSTATSYVRTQTSAAATQASVAAETSVATQAGVASIAPPASALPPPAAASTPAPAPLVVRPTPAPTSPPEARVLLAARPRTTTSHSTSAARPPGPVAKKNTPATTRSGATAKGKPAAPKPAAKPAPKPATAKPATAKPASAKPASAPASAPQPMKPDPVRPGRTR